MPDHQIVDYVDSLISSLGLQSIRHELVGSLVKEGGRGISGGEYKRVSIAVALAGAPRALVLDKPTSGLDATAAHLLMKLLHSISRQGIMVIWVIHQPRVEIFDLLDDLLVLNAGAQMYLGKAAEAQSVFERLGHKFPVASNPADVILDILINHPHTEGGERASLQGPLEDNPSPGAGIAKETLVKFLHAVKQRKASWPPQLWLTFHRSTKQQSRQTTGLALGIVSSSVVGLMIGLSAFESRGHFFQGIYYDPFDLLSSAVDYRLVTEQALLCCLAIACAAGPSGVKVFEEEKLTFHRESQSGHSRSAYFLGKNLAICFRMLLSSLHFTAFYLVLATPMIPFRVQLGLGILYYYCIYGLGFIVSAVTRREDGPLLCMLLSLIISALSGCAPRLSTVRDWHLTWFWYSWPAVRDLPRILLLHLQLESTRRRAATHLPIQLDLVLGRILPGEYGPPSLLYDIRDAAAFTGYATGRTAMDMGFLVLIGTVYRVLSYILFVFWGWKARR
ncbi:hypothetical protein BDW59DRAFT_166606 [Aspergillus cavernicola]|uniref:ABC transporter domain-containing protein n=1 Tax=Aspergillus cavernicola TaxID=176166 RepID=A0ABR4HK56_9EURO